MAITSLDGRFEHVNPALCEITGYPREQLESMTFQSITPADDLGDDDRATEQLISGRISVYRNEKRYIHCRRAPDPGRAQRNRWCATATGSR